MVIGVSGPGGARVASSVDVVFKDGRDLVTIQDQKMAGNRVLGTRLRQYNAHILEDVS